MRHQLAVAGIVVVSFCASAISAPAQTMPIWASGKEVRISLDDATIHSGRLRSLSSTEVVISLDGQTIPFPLTRVRAITTMARPVKRYAAIGALAGALAGPVVLNCSGGECPEALIELPITAGVGAAAGAIVGAIAGRLQPAKPDRLIYQARTPGWQFVLTPVASRTVRGLSLTVRW